MKATWLLCVVCVSCGLQGSASGAQVQAGVALSPPNPARYAQYDPDDDYYDDGDDDEQPSVPPGNIYPSPYDDAEPGYDYQRDMAESRKREVEGDLSKILGDGRYDYCRNLEYRVRSGEYHLCKLKDAAKARCPGFAAACDKPPVEDQGSLVGGGSKRTTQRGEDKPKEPEKAPKAPTVSGEMSGAAVVVFWALLIGLALLLLFSVARNFRREEVVEKSEPEKLDEGDDFIPRPKRSPVETDIDRLLARARAAAQAGNFDQAMSDAHAALLRYLDGNGLIELHHSRTNGEYARHLREHPDLQAAFRASAREVEAVQFGAAQSGAEGFRRVMGRILPVLGRAAALVLAFSLLTQVVACGSSSGPSSAKSTPSGDSSPGGVSVLQTLLIERGSEVRHMDGKVEVIQEDVHTLVVHGPTDLEGAEWSSILAWVRRGGRLVVALDSDLPESQLSARRLGASCDQLKVAAGYPNYTTEKLTAANSEVLGLSTKSYWPILECHDPAGGPPEPYAVARDLGLGSVVVLPSSDLITNASMVSDDHAHVVMDLMFGTPSVVVFVDTWTGIGEESPFAAVGHGRLNPFLLQLFVLMGVLFWWKGRHFARPRDPPEAHRRAFSEHVQALGAQYAKARASRMALGMYAGWALERLRERCQPGGQRRGLLPLAAAISARTGRDEREVARILVESESARDAYTAPGEPVEDLKLMRELEALLADTGGIR